MIIIPSRFESEIVKASHYNSGMGKINSVMSVHHLHRLGHKKILLSGFCGGVEGVSVGEIVSPNFLLESDYDASPIDPFEHKMFFVPYLGTPVTMLTQDKFMLKKPELAWKEKTCVDMESYAVAVACQRLFMKLKIVKIVSDIVGENSAKSFLDSCKTLAPLLNQVIAEVIESWE